MTKETEKELTEKMISCIEKFVENRDLLRKEFDNNNDKVNITLAKELFNKMNQSFIDLMTTMAMFRIY